jgi:hypothetical protein
VSTGAAKVMALDTGQYFCSKYELTSAYPRPKKAMRIVLAKCMLTEVCDYSNESRVVGLNAVDDDENSMSAEVDSYIPLRRKNYLVFYHFTFNSPRIIAIDLIS